MKTLFGLLTMLLLLSSCNVTYPKQFRVDHELAPYYNSFQEAGQIRNQNHSTDDLILEFGDTTAQGSDVAGYCGTDYREEKGIGTNKIYMTPKIIINPSVFKNSDEYGRRNLIYHELGHCLLKRGHLETVNDFNYVRSMMFPRMITGMIGFLYPRVEESYVDELFNPTAPAVDPWSGHTGSGNSYTGGSKLPAITKTETFDPTKVYVTNADGTCAHDHAHLPEEVTSDDQ